MRAAAAAFLLAVAGCASAPPAPPAPPPQPVEVATPVPTGAQAPEAPLLPPPPPLPAAPPEMDLDPPLIKVLLERTTGEVGLPQPGRPFRATTVDGTSRWLWGPLTVRAGRSQAWQVGAFRDPVLAAEAADRLRRALGDRAEVDAEQAADGLLRVRVRLLADGEDAPEVLAGLGFAEAFPVAGGSVVEVADGRGELLSTGGEVLLEPTGDYPTAVGGASYRGRFRVRASGEEVLLVNELNLERYLRGVVPAEMGPFVFPELEALKAQAVAARTYAVAHLGDHADEGYDLCDTPACQVYAGVGAEHRLTDRAVDETAGLVATYDKAPIDAMYTSTCGGHTEDAAPLFPDRAQPYLVGVRCAWDRPLELQGSTLIGGSWDRAGFHRLVALGALGIEAREVSPQAVVDRVAELAGGRGTALSPVADGEALAAALLTAAGLDEATSVLTGGEDPVRRLLSLADLMEVDLGAPAVFARREGWALQAALAVLELQGVVTRDRGEAVPRPDGVGIYPHRADRSETLPRPLPLYERWDEAYTAVAAATVLPGTLLERIRMGGDVLALVVVRSGGDGAADRRSAWRYWARERSWDELASMLGVPDLVGLEVTRRTPSGRVVGLAAVGRSGKRRELEGFPIRRALDLPENLFTFHRLERPDGVVVVRFLGSGWGHGVGLCQNGSYGLARAGMTFDRILRHYYTGIDIERLGAGER